jgi:hypothetical protein
MGLWHIEAQLELISHQYKFRGFQAVRADSNGIKTSCCSYGYRPLMDRKSQDCRP